MPLSSRYLGAEAAEVSLLWVVGSIILLSGIGGHDRLCHCSWCFLHYLLYLYWCWKSWGSSYEVRVSVMPYGCTPSPWCAGSKGWTHLTLLLLENWWPHMPHGRGHGNRCCVKSSHAIFCGLIGLPAVCADSHWRPLEVERTAVLTKICFCALVVTRHMTHGPRQTRSCQ